jgi:hypothetical protein
MITETETFDDLTITAYDTNKIYIEMQRPIALSTLHERLAELGGTHSDQRGNGATRDEEGRFYDTTKDARDSNSGLQDQLAYCHQAH